MASDYHYHSDKSKRLRETRGLGFEEIIEYMDSGGIVDAYPHPNQKKRPNQWIYEVNVEGYIYVVPHYRHSEYFELRTLYPSRKSTKRYIGEQHE